MRKKVRKKERKEERKKERERERYGGMFIIYFAGLFLKRGVGEGCSCNKTNTPVCNSAVITPRVFPLYTQTHTLLCFSCFAFVQYNLNREERAGTSREEETRLQTSFYVYTVVVTRSILQ